MSKFKSLVKLGQMWSKSYPILGKAANPVTGLKILKPPTVKPKVKLSKKQWDALMERVVLRKSKVGQAMPLYSEKGLPKAAMPEAGGVLGTAPTKERLFGRLNEPKFQGSEFTHNVPQDYPLGEAMMRFRKSEGALTAPSSHIPPADVLSMKGGTPSYERRIFKNVAQPVKRAESAVADVAPEVSPKLGRPAVEKVSQAEISAGKIASKPSDELINEALLLDKMWQTMGGGRTYTGRMWKLYKETARGRFKTADTRDYFIRQGLRWRDNPEAYAKLHPREAKSLQSIWDNFMQEYGPGGVGK